MPTPRPAVLTVEPGWTTEATVRVGERSYPLDRPLRLEIPAGAYNLAFLSRVPGYEVREEQSVRLREGEQRRVANPIPRPALLTVRPHLNTPQGQVAIDGRVLGTTPLQRRLLRPGPHLLEILPLGSGDAGRLSQSIELATATELVVTFDLTGAQTLRLREQPAVAP